MRRPRTIACVASDPGGANALLPVMLRLAHSPHLRLAPMPYRQAQGIWQKRGLAVDPIDETFNDERARGLLRSWQVDLLLTGTSLNALEVEKKFISAARAEGIPSLSVLDFYSNYQERFSDARGPFSCLPDRVALLDDFSREQMVALGAPPERLVVTGQPAFDGLARLRRTSRAAARAAFGLAPGEQLVTFVSQPLIEMYGHDPASPTYPGYDQHQVLLAVLRGLETLAAQGRRLVLAVRIHPREDAAWFEALRSPSLPIRSMLDDAALPVIYASDLVVGMTSTLLLEGAFLGCVTLSVQPAVRRPEIFPAIAQGLIPAVYRYEHIAPTLGSLLLDAQRRRDLRARLRRAAPDSRATLRVLRLIDGMLNNAHHPI